MEKIVFKNKGEDNALPINATNLNQLQSNIETEFNTFDQNKLDNSKLKKIFSSSDSDIYCCNYLNKFLNKNAIAVKMDTDFNFVLNNYAIVNNWILDHKIGDKLSVEDGKVKVGSGVSKVKIHYFLGLTLNETDTFYAYPKINDTSILPWIVNYYSVGSAYSVSWESIASVKENDLISLAVYSTKTGKLEMQRNLMIVEVIE